MSSIKLAWLCCGGGSRSSHIVLLLLPPRLQAESVFFISMASAITLVAPASRHRWVVRLTLLLLANVASAMRFHDWLRRDGVKPRLPPAQTRNVAEEVRVAASLLREDAPPPQASSEQTRRLMMAIAETREGIYEQLVGEVRAAHTSAHISTHSRHIPTSSKWLHAHLGR